MKRVYVNEKWCLGCHLCEFHCAYAQTNESGNKNCKSKKDVFADDKCNMALTLKEANITPRIKIEEGDNINFAVSCRHCTEPLCVKSCITGALTINDGIITIDKDKCINCYTCVLTCPYGAIAPSEDGVIDKCELCVKNKNGTPQCVEGCPNGAIVFEER